MERDHRRERETGSQLGISGKERIQCIEDDVEAVREEFRKHEEKDVERFNETNLKIEKLAWKLGLIIVIAGFLAGVGKDLILSKVMAAPHEAKEK